MAAELGAAAGARSGLRFRILLAALLGLLLGYPLVIDQPRADVWLLIALGAVFVAAIRALGAARMASIVGAALLLPAIVSRLSGVIHDDRVLHEVALLAEAAFYGLVLAISFRAVSLERFVSIDTLAGAVCIYLLLALAWSALYELLMVLDPGAFHLPEAARQAPLWTQMLYFSFTALTTVGYGDVTPVSMGARTLASLESVTGVLYTAMMISVLVGQHLSDRSRIEAT